LSEFARYRGLPARTSKQALPHGQRARISYSSLADANEVRDWRYADFAESLIGVGRRPYTEGLFGVDLKETLYALESVSIDLCLSVFRWAHFRATKVAVKLHTLPDLRGAIPSFIYINDGKLHDINALDVLIPELGAFYVMDRGYLDFAQLDTLHKQGRSLLRVPSRTLMRHGCFLRRLIELLEASANKP
jgi:hypothetical protein